jgi:hypothetical protein
MLSLDHQSRYMFSLVGELLLEDGWGLSNKILVLAIFFFIIIDLFIHLFLG